MSAAGVAAGPAEAIADELVGLYAAAERLHAQAASRRSALEGRPAPSLLVPILVALEGALLVDADIRRLARGELCELGADLLEVERGDLFVEALRKGVDLSLILGAVGPELDLGEGLVGEARRHDEARVAGGVA